MAREGIMLAYAFTEKRFKSYPKPCIVQPKLEGDRMRVPFDAEGKPTLLSSGAKEKLSVPHIKAILEEKGHRLVGMELDGELYVHGMPHENIRSITSRTVDLHSFHTEMEYHIYDLVQENLQQEGRIRTLDYLAELLFPLIIVEHKLVYDLGQLEEIYFEYLEMGYEGIIIRDPNAPYIRRKATTMMKLKPFNSDTFEVVGYAEEISINNEPKNRLGSLACKTLEGEIFSVGTGFDHTQRLKHWLNRDHLIGRWVKIRFQALTEDRQVPKMLSFEGFVDPP